MRIVNPFARDAVAGHDLGSLLDGVVVSRKTGSLKHRIQVDIDLNFTTRKPDIICKESLAQENGRPLPGLSCCPNVDR
jgi:hypothetical protein